MALVLFYFPKVVEANAPAKWFREAGIGEMIADGDAMPEVVSDEVAGPDQGRGRLAFWEERTPNPQPRLPQVDLERQVWHALPPRKGLPAGRAWIGWYKEQPPTPSDLLRKRPLQSVDVELGSYAWSVPVARLMPKVFGFSPEGVPIWNLEQNAHQAYAERSLELAQKMNATRSEAGWQFDENEHLEFTEQALQLNYRVCLEMLGMMRAIRSDRLCLTCFAASQTPLNVDDIKKNGLSSAGGEAA